MWHAPNGQENMNLELMKPIVLHLAEESAVRLHESPKKQILLNKFVSPAKCHTQGRQRHRFRNTPSHEKRKMEKENKMSSLRCDGITLPTQCMGGG
jgi:hypothetical protein